MIVSRAIAAAVVLVVTATVGSSASAGPLWSFVGTNAVASSPVQGGGYPVPPGRTKPDPGTCGSAAPRTRTGPESWIAVEPGTLKAARLRGTPGASPSGPWWRAAPRG